MTEQDRGAHPSGVAPRRALGVSGRLIAALIVPVLVLGAVLGTSLARDHRDVLRADEVAQRVILLRQHVELRSALFRERLAAEIFVPERRPPRETLQATTFGALIDEAPDQLAVDTDATLAAIPAPDRPFDSAALERARAASPNASPAVGAAQSSFDEVDEILTAAMTADLTFVRESAIQLGDVRLIRAGAMFERTVQLPEEAALLVAALADLWTAAPADRPAVQSRVAMALATFTRASGRLAAAADEVDPWSPVALGLSLAAELPEPLGDVTDAAIAGELTTPERGAGEPAEVGAALLDGVDWLLEVDRVPTLAADEVTAASEQVSESASAAQLRTAALAIAAVLASIAAAVLFGRSIVGPVRRLTDQAEQIGSGQLDTRPRLKGPPEIVRASDAMNDVVDNLVLLERKSNALAHADFDDDSLRQPLPGRLGKALQLSMEVLSDSVEEREQLQARLEFEASHDSLTGIGNRASITEELRRLCDQSAMTNGSVAVTFIDLNGFKGINDRHGHAVGDEVLRIVATRMVAVAPARSLVARLGGDEFVIVMPVHGGVDEPLELARRVTAALAVPIEVDGRTLGISASAGVAVAGIGADGEPVEAASLLHMADLAVYTAKRDPDDNIAVYDDQLDQRLIRQREIEESLASALRAGSDELRLVYQPVVDAEDARLHRVEALLRWTRPGIGAVAPDIFIPIAERSDLIIEVDRWVTEAALRQLSGWNDDGTSAPVAVAVNISGRSVLDRAFVDRLANAVVRSGVRPELLSIEVTETALVTDLELAASQLATLRSLGLRVVIDDFGTGYTSVAHLRALPVDELKIDASFVQLLPDPDNRSLIEMITQLAHQMNLPVVAEGVETLEQVEALRSIGCDRLQGYYFSRPLEPADLAGWMAGQGATRGPAARSSS